MYDFVIFKADSYIYIHIKPHIIISIKVGSYYKSYEYEPHVLTFKCVNHVVISTRVPCITIIVPYSINGGSHVVNIMILLLPFLGAKLS